MSQQVSSSPPKPASPILTYEDKSISISQSAYKVDAFFPPQISKNSLAGWPDEQPTRHSLPEAVTTPCPVSSIKAVSEICLPAIDDDFAVPDLAPIPTTSSTNTSSPTNAESIGTEIDSITKENSEFHEEKLEDVEIDNETWVQLVAEDTKVRRLEEKIFHEKQTPMSGICAVCAANNLLQQKKYDKQVKIFDITFSQFSAI